MVDSSNPPSDASSSNPTSDTPTYTPDSFLHASNANVSIFISVRVSNDHTYGLWKKQMLCLLHVYNMVALVDDTIEGSRASSNQIMDQYNSLLKGWIFGTISEDLLTHVIDFALAKDVWGKLKSIYGPTMSSEIVKLSGQHNYHLWKTQMLWLMKNHNVDGFVDDTIDGLRALSKEIMEHHESLLKEWIFDSVSPDLLMGKINRSSAKEIWDYLKWNYDPTLTSEIVKLSGQHNYHLWKTQMLSLMNNHNINGLVDDMDDSSRDSRNDIIDQYDSLSRSWILETISNDVCLKVNHLRSAKEVWDELKSIYGPPMSSGPSGIVHGNSEIEDITKRNENLCRAAMEGQWWEVETILIDDTNVVGEAINNNGETVLHIAVATGLKYFVRNLLEFINDKEILERRSSDGSTALHIAAITGNKYAAELLIQREKSLMEIRNRAGTLPYVAAYFNNHFDTSVFLFKATHLNRQSMRQGSQQGLIDRNLLLDIISTKQYDLALQLFESFPNLPVKDNAEVLMALARNFPSGLDYGETLIYPYNFSDIRGRIVEKSGRLFTSVAFFCSGALVKPVKDVLSAIKFVLLVLVTTPILVYWLILFLIWIVHLPFLMLYFVLWKVAARRVPPFLQMEKKKKEWEKAKKVLKIVCKKIDESEPAGTHQSLYKMPILEAACQNAYEVVDEILSRSPEAIRWIDKSGYNIIHLAVIHRSEKIYNLIYDSVDLRSLYKTRNDSSKNNILHLAGRLAPSSKLKRRTGAALQLQRELQWKKEVEKLVVPTFITQKNMDDETPGMVFTREHDKLVKEGEKWMKTTAESCSITAALITTIVFAAAITVPGGSNEQKGIPLFTEEAAFITFAVSDAISLCASTTSLLMFLSILTTRFAEQDFLIKLPRKLIIGLFSLLVSTTAMMVAFGATLFLVFSHQKVWMLGPICGLVVIPISTVVILQVPLIVHLILSTYVSIFGKRINSHRRRFNPNDLPLLLYKLFEYIWDHV